MGLFSRKKKEPEQLPIINAKGEEAMADPSIILVDSRSYEEYCDSHIPGSINIPYDDFRDNESMIEQIIPDKDAKIYLYSLDGNWSWSSMLLLKDLGYANAEDIGTLDRWLGDYEYGDPNMPDELEEPEQPTE